MMLATLALSWLMGSAPNNSTLADRINAFGEKLWQEQRLAGGNQALAPVSVSLCLSMLISGANQPTRTELAQTLGLSDMTDAQVGAAAKSLTDSLRAAGSDVFTMANAAWFKGSYTIRAEYLQSVRNSFDAEVRTFEDPGRRTVDQINDWVSEHTSKRISKIFEHLDRETSAVLVNALTFDGKWEKEFDPIQTASLPFHAAGGDVNVPTMRQRGHYSVANGEGYRAATLPYASGRFVMQVLLPNPGQTPSTSLSQWLTERNAPSRQIGAMASSIELPKFKIECSYDLKPALGLMGLAPLYREAKFGRIATPMDRETRIDQIQHKTYIEVDEKGTKAAAATGVAVVTRAAPVAEPFRVDRPFAFAIIDTQTGLVLMLGTVAKP